MRTGILTASDRCSRGERRDESGLLLKKLAEELPSEVIAYHVFPDDKIILKKALCTMSDSLNCDIIFTTGGTGLGPRDVTPDATRAVIEKEVPGIAEMLRWKGSQATPLAVLSRGLAGVRGKTLIINLPGSPKAVLDCFEILKPILAHAAELLGGRVKDCREAREKGCRREHSSHLLSSSHS